MTTERGRANKYAQDEPERWLPNNEVIVPEILYTQNPVSRLISFIYICLSIPIYKWINRWYMIDSKKKKENWKGMSEDKGRAMGDMEELEEENEEEEVLQSYLNLKTGIKV